MLLVTMDHEGVHHVLGGIGVNQRITREASDSHDSSGTPHRGPEVVQGLIHR